MRYLPLTLLLFISFPIFAQNDLTKIPESSDSITGLYYFPLKHKRNVEFVFATNLQVDFQLNDFSNFNSLLEDYNIELMNKSVGIFDLELNGFINNWMVGLDYGYNFNSAYDHDSLDLEFNTTNFGLIFGYRIFESKRFILVPKVNIKWNHYRLINSDNQDRIPISKYLDERDLDIRFNQIIASVGLKMGYKIYKVFPWMNPYDYLSVGIYGGYLGHVNQRPWIYSLRNRLLTRDKIIINHINLGFSFTFYLD